MELIVKMMIGLNMIGFMYRLNYILSIQLIYIYPFLLIIYNQLYFIISLFVILYFIFKIVYIYDELITVKKLLEEIRIDIIKNNKNI